MSDLDKLIQRYNPIDKNKWLLEELEEEQKSFGQNINDFKQQEDYGRKKQKEAENLEEKFNVLGFEIPRFRSIKDFGGWIASGIGTYILGPGSRVSAAAMTELTKESLLKDDKITRENIGENLPNIKDIGLAIANMGPYKDYYWKDFDENLVPASAREFEKYKQVHEGIRNEYANFYEDYPWMKSLWSYVTPAAFIKVPDLIENVLYEMTKSPSAMVGMVQEIGWDPINQYNFKGLSSAMRGVSARADDLAGAAADVAARDIIHETAERVIKNGMDDASESFLRKTANVMGMSDDTLITTTKSGIKGIRKKGYAELLKRLDDASLEDLSKIPGILERQADLLDGIPRNLRDAGKMDLSEAGIKRMHELNEAMLERIKTDPVFRKKIMERLSEIGDENLLREVGKQLELFDELPNYSKYKTDLVKNLRESEIGSLLEDEIAKRTKKELLKSVIRDPKKYLSPKGIVYRSPWQGKEKLVFSYENLDRLKLYKVGEYLTNSTPKVVRDAVETMKKMFVPARFAPQELHDIAVKHLHTLTDYDKTLVRVELLKALEKAGIDVSNEITDAKLLIYVSYLDVIDDVGSVRNMIKEGKIVNPELAKKLDILQSTAENRLKEYQDLLDVKGERITAIEEKIADIKARQKEYLTDIEQIRSIRRYMEDLDLDEYIVGKYHIDKQKLGKLFDQVEDFFDEYSKALDDYSDYIEAKEFVEDNMMDFAYLDEVAQMRREFSREKLMRDIADEMTLRNRQRNVVVDGERFKKQVMAEYHNRVERLTEAQINYLHRNWEYRTYDDYLKQLRKENPKSTIDELSKKAWELSKEQPELKAKGKTPLDEDFINQYIEEGWYDGYTDSVEYQKIAKQHEGKTITVGDLESRKSAKSSELIEDTLQAEEQIISVAEIDEIVEKRAKRSALWNNTHSIEERVASIDELIRHNKNNTMTLTDIAKNIEKLFSENDLARIKNYHKSKMKVDWEQYTGHRITTDVHGNVLKRQKMITPFELKYARRIADDLENLKEFIINPQNNRKYYPGDNYKKFLETVWDLNDEIENKEFISLGDALLKDPTLTVEEIEQLLVKHNQTRFPIAYEHDPLFKALPKEAQDIISETRATMDSLEFFENKYDRFTDPMFIALKEGDEIVWQGDLLSYRDVDSLLTYTSDSKYFGNTRGTINEVANDIAEKSGILKSEKPIVPNVKVTFNIGKGKTQTVTIKDLMRSGEYKIGKKVLDKDEVRNIVNKAIDDINVRQLNIKKPGTNTYYTTLDLEDLIYESAVTNFYKTSSEYIPTARLKHWNDVLPNQARKFKTKSKYKTWDNLDKTYQEEIYTALTKDDFSKKKDLNTLYAEARSIWDGLHRNEPDMKELNEFIGIPNFFSEQPKTRNIVGGLHSGTSHWMTTGEFFDNAPGGTGTDFQKYYDEVFSGDLSDLEEKNPELFRDWIEGINEMSKDEAQINEGVFKDYLAKKKYYEIENAEYLKKISEQVHSGADRIDSLMDRLYEGLIEVGEGDWVASQKFKALRPKIFTNEKDIISSRMAQIDIEGYKKDISVIRKSMESITNDMKRFKAKNTGQQAYLKGQQTMATKAALGKTYKKELKYKIPSLDEIDKIIKLGGWDVPKNQIELIESALTLNAKEQEFARKLADVLEDLDTLGDEFGVSRRSQYRRESKEIRKLIAKRRSEGKDVSELIEKLQKDSDINPYGPHIPLYFKNGKAPDYIVDSFTKSSKFNSRKAYAADMSAYHYAEKGDFGVQVQKQYGTPIQYLDQIGELSVLEMDAAKSPIEIGLTTIVNKKANLTIDAVRNQIVLSNFKKYGLADNVLRTYKKRIDNDALTNKISLDQARESFKRAYGFDPYDFNRRAKTDIEPLKGYWFEPKVADYINQASTLFKNKHINSFIEVVKKFNQWWKEMATVMIPGFHSRNAQSNLYNLWYGQGAAAFDLDVHTAANKMLRGQLDDVITVYGGKKYTYQEFLDLAHRNSLFDLGQVGGDIVRIEEGLIKFGEKAKRNKLWDLVLLKSQNYFARKGRGLGLYIENEARLAGFINEMKKHGDPAYATRQVNSMLFNYRDITLFESTILKNIFPFYTWSRKNIPFQWANLFQQPGKLALIYKLKRYVEGLNEEPEDWEELEPSYMKELLGFMTGFENQAGERLVLNPAWPFQDLFFNPVTDPINMLTPGLKVPLETVANKQFYTDQPIFDERYSDIKESAFGYIPGVNDEGEPTWYIHNYLDYLIRQIPILQNLGKTIPLTEAQEIRKASTLAGIGLGVKFMPYDETNARYFYYKDYVEQLRQEIDALKKKGVWDEDYLKIKEIETELYENFKKTGEWDEDKLDKLKELQSVK